VKRLLREPILHFLVLGAVLFLLAPRGRDTAGDLGTHIIVTNDDLNRLSATWQRQWRRLPSAEELAALVRNHVREEVLYREAIALGLDQDDTIIRRRLVQKMEFLSEDTSVSGEPDDEELASYLAANPERFELPTRLDFRHVYFSTDRRGRAADADARELLSRLERAPAPADLRSLGDRFMLQHAYSQKSPAEVGQLFGRDFATRIFELETGSWQGPVESGYGLHLVHVDKKVDARAPRLDEVRHEVARDYLTERREQADERMYEQLRARYDVEIEDAELESALADTAEGSP
jgi:hypothetical protein